MNKRIKGHCQSEGSMQEFGFSSKNLSRISLGLWLASLPFTGLVLYADQRELKGIEILAMGWLGLLTFNFAWLANPIFLLTVWRISAKKKSLGMATICLLLAIDTVRFSSMLLDEGGGTSSVYGYGWGAILWVTAMCLVLAAAGTLEMERAHELTTFGVQSNASSNSIAMRFLGFALGIFVLTITGILFYRDHSRANQAELLRLNGLAFKRGEVCAAPEPKTQSQIDISGGVVEVIIANGALSAYPFNGPKQLLEWGLPKVRFDNRDYYLVQLDGKKSMVSDASSGTPVAQLFVSSGYLNGRSRTTVKLVAGADNKTIFNQTWLAETKASDRFCPEFSSFPSVGMQPRKLLVDALRGGERAPNEMPHVTPIKAANTSRITASIVSIKEYADRPTGTAKGGWNDPRPAGSLGWRNNRNCPTNIGWGGAVVKQNSARLETGWPFLIGEKSFYLGSRDEYNALCQGDFVYLSTTSANNGKNFINIEKRSLTDFQLAWNVIVVIEKQITPYPRNNLKLNHVSETDTRVALTVINEHDWTEVEIVTPIATTIRP